jgi:hypothetical protein
MKIVTMCVSVIDTQVMQWFFIGKNFALKKKPLQPPKNKIGWCK